MPAHPCGTPANTHTHRKNTQADISAPWPYPTPFPFHHRHKDVQPIMLRNHVFVFLKYAQKSLQPALTTTSITSQAPVLHTITEETLMFGQRIRVQYPPTPPPCSSVISLSYPHFTLSSLDCGRKPTGRTFKLLSTNHVYLEVFFSLFQALIGFHQFLYGVKI